MRWDRIQPKVYMPLGTDVPRSMCDIKTKRKGVRRMPWLLQAKKDVISCEKPRVGANDL